jgi:hypothetical protein
MREFLTERLAHIESVDVEFLEATAAHIRPTA